MRFNVKDIQHNYENIDYNTFRQIVKSKRFECIYRGKPTIFTSLNPTIFTYLQEREEAQEKKVIRLNRHDFVQLTIDVFNDCIKDFALNTRSRNGDKSVKNINFKLLKFFIFLLIGVFVLLLSYQYTREYFLLSVLCYYSICLVIKLLFFFMGVIFCLLDNNDDEQKIRRYNENDLPIYTLLIPVYHENKNTILQIIQSISEINYPREKLDILLVLEENDTQTKNIINILESLCNLFENYYTKVYVPDFKPQTKPKACNVACLFASGDYVVIYDAEDRPQKYQLIDALECFDKNKDLDVAQCNLLFYNYKTNILTELFNIEYNVWFKIILRTISKFKIPMPLGGTSNHFKFETLEKNGFWDGYNVTEDLEIGTILNYKGYKMKHLNSDTKEWCVTNLKTWFRQRRRWMKGYMLTTFMYLFDRRNFKSLKTFVYLNIFVFYTSFCFLLIPLLIMSSLYWFFHPIMYIYMFVCVLYYLHYIVMYFVLSKKSIIKITPQTIFAFILYPFYFILHHIATWLAFYDIFRKPFYWGKTSHDL